jgi:hypothetical protein
MLIEIISTERLFLNELFIYRKDDSERVNKDFIITKTSRVHKSTETRWCRAFDQSSRMQNIRMRLKKILLALTSKEVWLSSCAIQSKFFLEKNFILIWIRLKLSDSLRFEFKIFNSKRIFSTRIKCLASIEIF